MSSKEELIKNMRFHQAEYSKYAEQLKVIDSEEKLETYKAKQLKLLASFREKLNFYVDTGKPVDWEEVEKLITSSFGQQSGHALGYDETGAPGLGLDYGSNSAWSPMVEEESDIRKFKEREAKRREIQQSKAKHR